jgi:ribosomal protein S18 acetylase RimI-like enzyme
VASASTPSGTSTGREASSRSESGSELDYATSQWSPETFRLFVAAWNERAIRLYERLGFSEVGRETRHFELVGEHEFIQMERTA